MRKFLQFNYESEIRLSFLFLILFFVLINFGISYLLNLSRNNWREEHFNNFKGIAYSASQLWQNSSGEMESGYELKNLVLRWGAKKIEILNQEGEILLSSGTRIEKGEKPRSDLLSDQLKTKLLSGKSFFSDAYPGNNKKIIQSYFYSFIDNNSRKVLFARAEKEVTSLIWIERISRYEGVVRAIGVLGMLFLSFLLLRNIFSPYKRMKLKAEEEKFISPSSKREDVEAVVEVFQKVIAELKEKERKLQELYLQTDNKARNLEKYNEYILKSINNGVIICDNQGRITGFNQAAQKLLGSSYKLGLELHYREISEGESSFSRILDEVVIRKKLSRESEIEIRGEKGEKRFLMINNALLKDEEENIIGLVVVLSDLTELKKIQQEIAFKKRMASLGEISAGLAHELRNSMGALLGYSKMLKKGIKENNALYPVVDSIISESLTLENLLQRFLDFAKPLEVKQVRFNLADLIQDCLRTAEERKPDLKISFNAEEGLSYYTGDPILLRQVFHNLIMNSLESLGVEGEIMVNIQKIEIDQTGFIQIDLKDNGCGIKEENLVNIFNPFFTSKETGIGLGLSVAKKIVDLHKGKIEVKSELKKGTVFSVFLPLSPSPVKTKESPDSVAVKPQV